MGDGKVLAMLHLVHTNKVHTNGGGGGNWPYHCALTFSTMMRSPTLMSALDTYTMPVGVNFLYFFPLISRSRLNRLMSSIASLTIVTHITNV